MKKYFIAGLVAYSSLYATSFSGLFLGVSGGCSFDLSEVDSTWRYINLFGGAPDAAGSGTEVSTNNGDISYVVDFTVDYNYALSERKYFDVGVAFFINGSQSITSKFYSFPNPNHRADTLNNYYVTTTLDPGFHMAVGVKPGYALTQKMLCFGSLSFHYMHASMSTQTYLNPAGLAGPVVIKEASGNADFYGGGVGLGAKYKFSDCWFVDLTTEWISFGGHSFGGPNLTSTGDEITQTQSTVVNPSWVDLRLGLSYRF